MARDGLAGIALFAAGDPWWFHLPAVYWTLVVFALGLGVGSFLNVLVARLPFEKSVLWPAQSYCFHCVRPIRFWDNVPVLGYLRLRGRCRFCGAKFSGRYLWIELFTGLAFAGLFVLEVVLNWHNAPGLDTYSYSTGSRTVPPLEHVTFFLHHAILLALLIAAAVIDWEHKIIPAQITVVGTLVGLLGSAVFPWPWPNPVGSVPVPLEGFESWMFFEYEGKIPTGSTLWPFWGPPPAWAPPGSLRLGLMNGLLGAAVGMLIGRTIKFVFENAMGKEALGLGDADLLMMAGAFLGWQPVALALPAGAMISLLVIIPAYAATKLRGKGFDPQVPFGPGIAAGVVACWLGWPWLQRLVQATFFNLYLLGIVAVVMFGGLFIGGLILRRPAVEEPAEPAGAGR